MDNFLPFEATTRLGEEYEQTLYSIIFLLIFSSPLNVSGALSRVLLQSCCFIIVLGVGIYSYYMPCGRICTTLLIQLMVCLYFRRRCQRW